MTRTDEKTQSSGGQSRLLARSSRPSKGGLALRAAAIAGVVTLLLGLLSTHTRIVDRLEHWLGDWRFAIAGAQLPAAHPEVTLLLVREESLLESGRLSPVDRAVIADLIGLVDGFDPRVIGIDFIFDVETAQDSELLAALQAATSPIVLGAYEERGDGADALQLKQRRTQLAFLETAGKPYGYVNLATDFDRVVRRRASPVEESGTISFSDLLAQTAGAPEPANGVERIDWLTAPKGGGDPFTRIFADQLDVLKARPDVMERLFKDRVVILAAGLQSMSDYHLTPLDQGDTQRTMGAEIVAQMVAQRLDQRRVREFDPVSSLIAAASAAFLAALLTLRHGSLVFDAPLSLALLFGFDILIFVVFSVIAPLGVMMAAVGLATISAELVRPTRAAAPA